MRIAFYITNHGYGHAARNVPIIQELIRRRSNTEIVIKSDKIRTDFLKRNLSAYADNIRYFDDCRENGFLLREGSMEPDIEIMEKAACVLDAVRIRVRLRHDIRIDIDEQHAERDRNEKQRLKSMLDCQIQEHTGHRDHDIVAPCQIQERCLIQQVGQCICNVRHFLTSQFVFSDNVCQQNL